MHFCDSNYKITQMQQDDKEQHQRAGINCILMKI